MTLQQIESRQGLDQVAIARNHARINKLAGPLQYSVVNSYVIPNLEDLGDPQVSNNPTNPATAEIYAGDQQVSTGGHFSRNPATRPQNPRYFLRSLIWSRDGPDKRLARPPGHFL